MKNWIVKQIVKLIGVRNVLNALNIVIETGFPSPIDNYLMEVRLFSSLNYPKEGIEFTIYNKSFDIKPIYKSKLEMV